MDGKRDSQLDAQQPLEILSKDEQDAAMNRLIARQDEGEKVRFERLCAEGDALVAVGDLAAAADLYRLASESGHAKAHRLLADVLYELSEDEESTAAYRRAAEAGEISYCFLAGVLDEDGADDVEATLRIGAEHGEADSAFKLGLRLWRHAEVNPAAEAALRIADDLGHAEASLHLGLALDRREATDEAAAAYQRASDRGNVHGAFKFGRILLTRGDAAAGEAMCASAEAGYRGLNSTFPGSVGDFFERHGDTDTAEDAYRRGDVRGSAYASKQLGHILAARNDVPGAEEAFWRAVERGEQRGGPGGNLESFCAAGDAARALRGLLSPDDFDPVSMGPDVERNAEVELLRLRNPDAYEKWRDAEDVRLFAGLTDWPEPTPEQQVNDSRNVGAEETRLGDAESGEPRREAATPIAATQGRNDRGSRRARR